MVVIDNCRFINININTLSTYNINNNDILSLTGSFFNKFELYKLK